jgi:hypothetical protein
LPAEAQRACSSGESSAWTAKTACRRTDPLSDAQIALIRAWIDQGGVARARRGSGR